MSDKSTPEAPLAGNSLWNDAWQRLIKNRMAIASIYIIAFIGLLCFLVPLAGETFAPSPDENPSRAGYWFKDPNFQELSNTFAAPSSEHWLGTDQSGRDLLSRLLFGGQISLLVGLIATSVSLVIGVTYGAIAGYLGGRVDTLMMRFVDILYGLPFLVLVILFSLLISEYMADFGKFLRDSWHWDEEFVKKTTNLIPLFIAIGSLGWLTMARMARAQVMSLKKQEFVEAAVSLGLSNTKILFKHIVPNMLGPVIVYSTLTVPGFILFEAALSYLGLGVESPNSSWGILLKDGANYMETFPSLLIIPSVVFSLTLLALNFLGDGLRDALDPKSSKD